MNKRKLLTDRQRLVQCHDGQRTLRLFGSRLDGHRMGAVRGMLSGRRQDLHRFKVRGPSSNDNGAGSMQG
jgi:hypothetical protein